MTLEDNLNLIIKWIFNFILNISEQIWYYFHHFILDL